MKARAISRKAVETLQQILSSSEPSFKEQATLNLARIYGLSNQPDKAKETLKDFIEKYKNSPFLSMAKARLNDYSS